MKVESHFDGYLARRLQAAGIYTLAELQREIVEHGLVRRKQGGWQFSEGGPRLRNCGVYRWAALLDVLKEHGFDWERYVKNVAPIMATTKELPPAQVTAMIPAIGWKAVYANDTFERLFYSTLIAWARIEGQVVGLVVDKSGQVVAANVNRHFLGYLETASPDTEDFEERMAALRELLNGK